MKETLKMKKALFIDRDGTLILEPSDEQIDSFEKLEFYPEVFRYLGKIAADLSYELVMVTNQDGLGTDSFPEDTFWPVQNFILRCFANEGVTFSEICIDRTFPEEGADTRKPGTGMLGKYFSETYDLAQSYVIGDRLTDMELARNLGARGIYINNDSRLGTGEITVEEEALHPVIALECREWRKIYEFLRLEDRVANHRRQTGETKVEVKLNLDGAGQSGIHTGLAFFDHMLEQLARHGQLDLEIRVEGDLHIDEHHSIEDTAIALGEAFHMALGSKLGIERYGFCLPMDDCMAQVALDFGGRSWLVWDAAFRREMVGDMPTEMFHHFFKSFADGAKANLNVRAEGDNEHHKIEAIFKAFAKAIKMAVKRDPENMMLPTTKGVL